MRDVWGRKCFEKRLGLQTVGGVNLANSTATAEFLPSFSRTATALEVGDIGMCWLRGNDVLGDKRKKKTRKFRKSLRKKAEQSKSISVNE